MPHRVTLMPGDGIGPEVAQAAVRVVEASGDGDVTPLKGAILGGGKHALKVSVNVEHLERR